MGKNYARFSQIMLAQSIKAYSVSSLTRCLEIYVLKDSDWNAALA